MKDYRSSAMAAVGRMDGCCGDELDGSGNYSEDGDEVQLACSGKTKAQLLGELSFLLSSILVVCPISRLIF